jgi:hypothetical protein
MALCDRAPADHAGVTWLIVEGTSVQLTEQVVLILHESHFACNL